MSDTRTEPVTKRRLMFTSLDDVMDDVRGLQATGYERAGNWNLGQCCTHLAIAMDLSIDGFPATLPPPISTLNHWLFFNVSWAPKLLGKVRFPSFPKAVPTTPVDDDVGVARLVTAIDRISRPDAVFRRNPFLGRLTQDKWLIFHAYHASRHLSFLVPNHSQDADRVDSLGNRNQKTAPA